MQFRETRSAMDTFDLEAPAAIENGRPTQLYGQMFSNLIDLGRLFANEMGEVVPGMTMNHIHMLRQSQPGMQQLLLLNSRMYSYWDKGPSGDGVYHRICKQYKLSEKNFLQKCICGNQPHGETGKTQHKACAGCRCAYYCSRDCQKMDWKTHKPDCKEWSKMTEDQRR
eukprot:scaffold88510_cov40-Prasinocladus_malaysianus.AAC.1